MAGRSEVDALSRSFRSRILLLALVLALGLAAALWTSTRETGIGASEDRRQLMVVTASREIDYYAVLERAGFAVEVDTLDGWLAAARVAVPDSEADGIAAVLELADQRGFALVVFERPSDLDFAGLEIDPSLDSIDALAERDYAALSVGDFAFPHRLTVDDPGDPRWLRLPGYGALQAVFRQELIGAREAPDRPTVAELQFEDAIRVGREMFERPDGFAAAIASASASVEATLADGSGARTLLPGLATGTPIPTPDGGILLFHHELVVFSDDARTLEIEAAEQMQLSWISPTAVVSGLETGELALEPCASLAGGAISTTELRRLEAAIDGSAIAIGSAQVGEVGEGGAIVWRKTDAPGCEWSVIAELDRAHGIVLAPRLLGSRRTVAAGVEHIETRSRVLVWALGEHEEEDGLLEPQLVIEQSGRRFGSLAFLDDRRLVVVAGSLPELAPDSDRLYLLDRDRPGVYLSLPVEFFAEGRTLNEVFVLAPANDEAGPELLVTAQRRGRLELIRIRVAAPAWQAFLAEQEPLEAGNRMVSLTPEQLETDVLFETASLLGISVRPDAVLVASADGPLPGELTSIDLATGERRQLTDNRIRDYLPRFAGDGGHATFVSLMRVSLSATPFSVPRVLALP